MVLRRQQHQRTVSPSRDHDLSIRCREECPFHRILERLRDRPGLERHSVLGMDFLKSTEEGAEAIARWPKCYRLAQTVLVQHGSRETETYEAVPVARVPGDVLAFRHDDRNAIRALVEDLIAVECGIGKSDFHVLCCGSLFRACPALRFGITGIIPTMPRQANHEEISKKFGACLRRLRGPASQAAFGRALGILSQPTYLRYERGRVPAPEILDQIATALGVTVESLLDDTANPRNPPAPLGSGVPAKSFQDLSTEELEHALVRYVELLESEPKGMRRSILVTLKQVVEALLNREV